MPLTYMRGMKYTAVVLGTLALLVVLYRLSEVVLVFVLSIIVAAGLRPGVRVLERRIPRSVAVLIWYVLILSVLGLLIFYVGGAVGRELSVIVDWFPASYDSLISVLQRSEATWQQSLARRLPTTESIIQSVDAGGAATIGYSILGVTSGILGTVVSIISVLTLTFYWVVDQERFERLWLTLLPTTERAIARRAWRDVERRVGAYVRSEAAQFVLMIIILWPVLLLVGVPYPALYAFYASVTKLVPWIGVVLALIPIAILAFSSPWWTVIGTAIVIIIVGAVMERLVEPWLRGDAATHPILTVLALVILAQTSGIIGMLIALPLAAFFQMLLSEFVRIRIAPDPEPLSHEDSELQGLRRHVEQLRNNLPEEERRRRRAQGMLDRLQALIDQADAVREREMIPQNSSRRSGFRAGNFLKHSKTR